jgi:hypothetical protein
LHGWKSRDDKEKDTGRMEAGRRQVGGKSEASRREVGGISLNWAFKWNENSGLQNQLMEKKHQVFFRITKLFFFCKDTKKSNLLLKDWWNYQGSFLRIA